ncbi:MAG: DNA repair protein RecO [Oscillospiraceae bacterium]
MFLTTKALVLREARYKEADKILTVLTADEGKLTVKARGAVRKGCKYGAAAQVLSYSEMTLFGNAGKWSINEAETIEQFLPLRQDIEALALGSYFAEALEAVSDEDMPNPEVLQLGLNSLYALSRGLYPQEHLKAAFELRLMCLGGFEPELSGCPVCGRDEPEDAMLSLNGGVLHCRSCPPGTAGVSLPVGPETLAAMRYIVSAEPKKVFAFRLSDEGEKQLSAVCEAYMAAQLERGFGALDYWKSVRLK